MEAALGLLRQMRVSEGSLVIMIMMLRRGRAG